MNTYILITMLSKTFIQIVQLLISYLNQKIYLKLKTKEYDWCLALSHQREVKVAAYVGQEMGGKELFSHKPCNTIWL